MGGREGKCLGRFPADGIAGGELCGDRERRRGKVASDDAGDPRESMLDLLIVTVLL